MRSLERYWSKRIFGFLTPFARGHLESIFYYRAYVFGNWSRMESKRTSQEMEQKL
ncbi:MAG: hypothetical protein ACJAUQ_001049 [Maribacter sp.]|jgi:hypothetical protein